jgi:hypothetical protein
MKIKAIDTRPRHDGYTDPAICDVCGFTSDSPEDTRCIDDNGMCEDCCMNQQRRLQEHRVRMMAYARANVVRALVEIRDSPDSALALETLEALQMHVSDCINKLTDYGQDIPDGDIPF